MTALAQGMAGLALVMGFALLCIRQIGAASVLLAVQSAAVAVAALVGTQPLMAIPPVLMAGGIFLMPGHLAALEPRTEPFGGSKLGVAAACVLAVLCQSQSTVALPLSIILLSVLLAATRRHPLMHVMALAGLQNVIVLAATQPDFVLPLACVLLPLPLAAGVLMPHPDEHRPASWYAWIDLALALAILVATVLVPLDPTASIFAPLLGLDGALRAWQRRSRPALSPLRRGLALLTSLFAVLAVASPDPIMAWLAILACITTSLLPTATRRWDDTVLAVLGAGIALFGLATPAPPIVSDFSIFAGITAIASVVPDLAPVLVILLLRLANHVPWTPPVEALAVGMALIALLGCAVTLSRRRSPALLQQSQAAVAALAIGLGQADGRFAALVLLILLILSRTAVRIMDRPGGSLAIAALGGIPPLGVFPGLVLVVLAISGHQAWLLLPMGAAFVPILLAALPRRLPTLAPSFGWLPMALALLGGYFAPDGLVRWWHVLTAGPG